MKKQIIADSCCDLSAELRAKTDILEVPLTIRVNEKFYVDDETLDTLELIDEMKSSEKSPSTSCPSPDDFLKAYSEEYDSFVVTLSSELSGTYNSAVLAKQIFQEEHSESFIHVFNSRSASVGETMISLKLQELINQGIENSAIVEKTEAYIEEMKTYFILESLDNLIKAGRISRFKGKLASLLSIVPIMKATEGGEIDLCEKVRGAKKAFNRLVQIIGEQGSSFEEKILGIAHCNCLEKAVRLKSEIESAYNFKDIVIVETQGISTVYANDGGIIIAF